MFVNLKIKNISGIKELISMDFIAKSRNREQSKSCIKTHDNIYINRQAVLIGSNASGKSSVLKAIVSIGNFICANYYRKKLLENIEADEDINELKHILSQISKIESNINTPLENSYFQADMYIVGKEKETTGYYRYELEFNNSYVDKENILREVLTYRENYKSKKEIEIVNIESIKESQVGYLYMFSKNLEKKDYITRHVNAFVDHYARFSSYIQANSIEFDMEGNIYKWASKNPKLVINLVNIFDSNINDLMIDKEKGTLFFITKEGNKIKFYDLSNGTKKILIMINDILQVVNDNGVCLIDEIEMGLYKELVNLVIQVFYSKHNYSQLIFSSNYPEIIDEKFKFDQVFCLVKEYDTTIITKLKDYVLNDGKKIRTDMSLSKAYTMGKISLHPNKEKIEEFVNSIDFDF